MVIRPFVRFDAAQLTCAIDSVCKECKWMSTSHFLPTPAWRHAFQHIDCKCHLLLVVEAEKQIVGWCRIFPEEIKSHDSRVTLGIGILSPYRNQGIGKKLIRQSLKWAVKAGYSYVWLTTHFQNKPALHVFKRTGFSIKRFDGLSALEMVWIPPGNVGRQGDDNGEIQAKTCNFI